MGNLQAILNVIDFGMNAQESVSAPRFTTTSSTIELTNRILRSTSLSWSYDGFWYLFNASIFYGFAG